ncbi:MAG: rRNA (cytidine-2'-O-)-methyltransferase, partial [Clostridia bacterium]|nr:rRNA (cytidine-2'-O-)-methyltransferase [Clostridia bacterium]
MIYFVATPIGNLKDISLRALEVLKEVDIIFCEDTRPSVRLLSAYAIEEP